MCVCESHDLRSSAGKIFNAREPGMLCSRALRAMGSAERPIDLTDAESERAWEAWKARFGVDGRLLEPSRWCAGGC